MLAARTLASRRGLEASEPPSGERGLTARRAELGLEISHTRTKAHGLAGRRASCRCSCGQGEFRVWRPCWVRGMTGASCVAATALALCVGFAPSEAEANVPPLDLASLVAASGTIVVGRVDSVDDGIATLVVERTIRGDSTWQLIRFRATRSWTCDDTHAEVGERLLAFFLEEDPTIPRGRNFRSSRILDGDRG